MSSLVVKSQSLRSAPARALLALGLVAGLGLSTALVPVLAPAASAQTAPNGMPLSFADLAERVSPAVVNITTTSTVATSMQGGIPGVPPGSPFEDFFRDFMPPGQGGGDGARPVPRRSQALGSGFIISADGFIVTNNHVIEGADQIQIETYAGEKLDAKVVGTDPNTDIALLKVEDAKQLPFVKFGGSNRVRVGEPVMAVGNPLGQGFSVSSGIVSASGRALQGTYDDYIQTDAAINRGNSGGPLFDMDGEVIGVNTAILSPNGGSIGIGFAMSSAVVSRVVDQLKEFGETRRGWLGVRIQDVTPDIAESMGLAGAGGALVTDVPEGPAEVAGIKSGDVITEFDGVKVNDTRELVRQVGATEVGKKVAVALMRDGKPVTVDLTLGRREEAEGAQVVPAAAAPEAQKQQTLLGMTVTALTPEMRKQLEVPNGTDGLVITGIDDGSEAFEKGLRNGDLITEAGQQKVATPKDLETRISEAKEAGRKSLLLLIRREGEPRFVALSVDKV